MPADRSRGEGMSSVTQRIKNIDQPYGGFVKPKEFSKIKFEDGCLLLEENLYAGTVATAVDYMTRYMMSGSAENAFQIPLMGARLAGETRKASTLVKQIQGLDERSIAAACKLVGYDICYRQGTAFFKGVDSLVPDEKTIRNILNMAGIFSILDYFDSKEEAVANFDRKEVS